MKLKIINNAHVRQLFDCSERTASRRILLAKDALGKKKYQVITVQEFYKYYDIPLDE